jgi:hypothetical protein
MMPLFSTRSDGEASDLIHIDELLLFFLIK